MTDIFMKNQRFLKLIKRNPYARFLPDLDEEKPNDAYNNWKFMVDAAQKNLSLVQKLNVLKLLCIYYQGIQMKSQTHSQFLSQRERVRCLKICIPIVSEFVQKCFMHEFTSIGHPKGVSCFSNGSKWRKFSSSLLSCSNRAIQKVS